MSFDQNSQLRQIYEELEASHVHQCGCAHEQRSTAISLTDLIEDDLFLCPEQVRKENLLCAHRTEDMKMPDPLRSIIHRLRKLGVTRPSWEAEADHLFDDIREIDRNTYGIAKKSTIEGTRFLLPLMIDRQKQAAERLRTLHRDIMNAVCAVLDGEPAASH
jgi:hypothetical protein